MSAADDGHGRDDQRPVLRVLNPDATAEEVAALVAVLTGVGRATEPPSRRRRPSWNAPERQARRPHRHGPGGWRASGLPR